MVTIKNEGRIRELEVRSRDIHDLVEIYFRGPEHHKINFVIGRHPNSPRKPGILQGGLHSYSSLTNTHEIHIDPLDLREMHIRGFSGGNKPAIHFRHAVGMAIVHELQHANQSCDRDGGKNLSRIGKYGTRATEIDARQAADRAFVELTIYFGQDSYL